MKFNDFPYQTFDKVRYRDTDRQGHVNNSVFSQYMETGRVELLYNPDFPLMNENCVFVIVSLNTDLKNEIRWPGAVEIGTRVSKLGNSSIVFEQCIYQQGVLVATSETVVVQMNEETRKSEPLNDIAKMHLRKYKKKDH